PSAFDRCQNLSSLLDVAKCPEPDGHAADFLQSRASTVFFETCLCRVRSVTPSFSAASRVETPCFIRRSIPDAGRLKPYMTAESLSAFSSRAVSKCETQRKLHEARSR